MTVGEDLRPGVGASDKRIIFRDTAVVTNTQYLADMIVQLLRLQPQTVVVGSVAADPVPIADVT